MPKLAKTALASAVGLSLLAAPALAQNHEADAQKGPIADNCWGTKQETRVLRDRTTNRRVGRIELWYSPADNGTNCVITYNEVPGNPITYAYLIVDDNKNRDNTGVTEKGDRVSYDSGDYEYFAGASYRRNTNGKCVKFGGHVISRQGHGSFGSKWVRCS